MGWEDWLGSEVLSRRHSSRHERILNSSSAPAPLRTLGSGGALAQLPLINRTVGWTPRPSAPQPRTDGGVHPTGHSFSGCCLDAARAVAHRQPRVRNSSVAVVSQPTTSASIGTKSVARAKGIGRCSERKSIPKP